jgi:hypothetical protein
MKRRVLLSIVIALAAGLAFAAGRTTTEVALIDMGQGVVIFSVEDNAGVKRPILYASDRHQVNSVYFTTDAKRLREIIKAAQDTLTMLEPVAPDGAVKPTTP